MDATAGRARINEGRGHAENDLIPAAQRPREHGPEFGHFGAVSQHAFGARRHMFEYGTTRNDFAAIAIGVSASMRCAIPTPS